MKHFRPSQFCSLFLSFMLLISHLPLIAMAESFVDQNHQDQSAFIEEASYVYLNNKLHNIAEFIFTLSALDADQASPLNTLRQHILNGFSVGLQDEVLQVLGYADWLLEQEHIVIDDVKRNQLYLALDNLVQAITEDVLAVDFNAFDQNKKLPLWVINERIKVRGKAKFESEAIFYKKVRFHDPVRFYKRAHFKDGIRVNGAATLQNAVINNLSVTDATIENLTLSGGIDITNLTLNSLTATDIVTDNLQVNGCIPHLCVDDLSVVNGSVSGTLSIDEAVVQSLDLTGGLTINNLTLNSLTATDIVTDNLQVNGCIPHLCVDDLSVVNGSVSGTLSIDEAVIQSLDLTGGLTINNLTLNSLTATDIVTDNLQVNGCIPHLCVDDLSVVNGSVSGIFSITAAVIQSLDVTGGLTLADVTLGTASITNAVIQNLDVTNCVPNLCVNNLSVTDEVVRNTLNFENGSGNFVGLQAPSVISANYTVSLPPTAPTANQILRANPTTPTDLEWATDGGLIPPSISEMIYVAKYGNDTTGDGSFSNPYLTLAKAVDVANTLPSTLIKPVVIRVLAGVYSENNSAGPIEVIAQGVSIVGDSPFGVTIMPDTLSNDLLLINQPIVISNIGFAVGGVSTASAISVTQGSLSEFLNLRILGFQTGVTCSGGMFDNYEFDNCFFIGNGTGLVDNGTVITCYNCSFIGNPTLLSPANTGVSILGTGAFAIIDGGVCGLCQTGLSISNNAAAIVSSLLFEFHTFGIIQTSGSQLTLSGSTFQFTSSPSDIDIQISGAGTNAQIIGCKWDGNGALGTPQATALMISDSALVNVSGGDISNFTTGIEIGLSTDTASTSLTVSSLAIRNCTTDIEQQGSASLNFNGGVATSTNIIISDPTNVHLAFFDIGGDNALTIGSTANVNTTLIQADVGAGIQPSVDYKSSLYSAQAIGIDNPSSNPTTLYVVSNNNADVAAITTNRTDTAGVRLMSDTGIPVGGTSALRGWDIYKNGSTAELIFEYQNNDPFLLGSSLPYTIMELNGETNQVQLPTDGTEIVFSGDTNVYRTFVNSVGVLKTDNNFIVGTLTPGRVVVTDGTTDELASSITTATELSYLSGVTSSIQTQLNNKVSRSGDTMTGTLQLPAGSTESPSLTFTGNPGVGLSASAGNLSLSTNGLERMAISSGGVVSIDAFTVPGVVHNDGSGNLSSLLISNADVAANAAIIDSKLATISTAGKVANSATTATSASNPSTIVLRDASDNFSAGIITANLIGNATTATSTGSFTGSLAGDVTGTQSATVVSFVGGQTAANVAAATVLANAATSVDTNNAIVRRDALGNFSATTITANLTGSASNNVLKAGDTMTGTLNMATQNAIDFYDAANTAFVGINAPAVVPTSYTLSLPSTVPTAHQVMRANSVTPTNLEWATEGGSVLPANSEMIYVAKYGNDSTGDGSFSNPYLTLSKAVDVANGLATLSNPIVIFVLAGVYVEDNSATPITVNAQGISIVGASSTGVTIIPNTPANTLLLVNQTVLIRDMTFANELGVSSAVGISFSSGAFSNMSNLNIINFQSGIVLAGGVAQSYVLDNCLFVDNGTGLVVNDTLAECNNCTFVGSSSVSGPPANTGINVTGVNSNVIVNSGTCVLCTTGFDINNNATLTASSVTLKVNTFAIALSAAAQMILSGCSFTITNSSGDIEIQASGAGTIAQIVGCEFDGNSALGALEATGIIVSDNAVVEISGGSMRNYTTGLVVGIPADASSTILSASSFAINNCTTDVQQQGSATLIFNSGVAASGAITINDPTNVSMAFFDTGDNNAFTIGSSANMNTTLLQPYIDPVNHPAIEYLSSLYSTQAVGFENLFGFPSTSYVLANNNATLSAITTLRTDTAGVRLVSDTASPVGGTTALRGWDIIKNGSAAQLAFNYQNSDVSGQSVIPEYTVMQLDGVNNQLQLPSTALAAPKIVFGGDTNLYRSSASVLKTDSNFIVGTLTPGFVVITDPATDQLKSSAVTDTELSFLSGVTSNVQTQLNGKVSKAGDIMTGTLQLPAGGAGSPSLTFTGSTTTGLFIPAANTLAFSTNGSQAMSISAAGVVAINNLTPKGVVHNDASGNLSSSLIVDVDITAATITNDKLATISSSNIAGDIVVRDGSGNFSAGTITANLTGNVTGNATTATTATNFSGSLSGDVTGTQSATIVSFVGGQTAASVAAATVEVNAATNLATANTLVERDGTGSFDAGTISLVDEFVSGAITVMPFSTPGVVHNNGSGLLSSSLIVDADITTSTITNDKLATISSSSIAGDIVVRDGSGNFAAGTITANLTGNATTATNFSGALSGDVTGIQSATVVSFVGGQTAANVASATVAVNNATNLATANTLVERDGTGSFAVGTISLVDEFVSGAITVTPFSTAGVVHNNASGLLSSSLIVDADITAATITNDKLAAISTGNNPNTIVLRDGSGNFTTNMITASEVTITGSITNPTDAATKAYVDAAVSTGLVVKTPALVASTTNVVLSGLQTIDGVPLAANDRVLLVGQTNPVENGLWLAQAGAWTRPADFANGTEAGEAYVLVTSGTINAGASWVCSTPTAIIGTDPLIFEQFSLPNTTTGANVGTGAGQIFRDKTGVTLNFKTIAAGPHIVVTNNANDVTLSTDATSANTADTLVSRDGSGNFSAGTITANLIGNATTATTATTATNFTGALSGDVTGTQGATVVSFVGGQSAANVASATVAVNNATNLATANTLVERDGTGSFAAGTISLVDEFVSGAITVTPFSIAGVVHNNGSGLLSSSLITNVDIANATISNAKLATISSSNIAGDIVVRDGSGNFAAGTITANLTGNATTATTATNFSGALSGDVTGTQSATVVSLVGGQTAASVAAATVEVNAATNLATANTLVERDGTGSFAAGTISLVDEFVSGAITVIPFSTAGIVHNNVSGLLSSSLITNVDIANATISNAKLATISSSNIAGDIVVRDGSGNFSAGTITANLTGSASNNLLLTGGTLTGSLTLPTGTIVAPSLNFTGSTTTGLSVPATNTLAFSTNGAQAMSISSAGVVAINSLMPTAGVVHNDTAGNLSSSLIVNADISNSAAITDSKLATISTAGKVANSATTATSSNTPNTIVLRDGSGNFTANIISATLNGSATNNVLKAGDTMTGTLQLPAGSTGSPSLTFTSNSGVGLSANTSNLSFSTLGLERMAISSGGVVSIDAFVVPGVVHNDNLGNLSSSLIVNADISATAAIIDSKLATISTAGKVANSATTATSANNPSTIVLRDASGNFSAGTITANLNGNATTATSAGSFSGSFSGDVTGTQNATVVSFVGGQTAANVAAATVLANAATSTDTNNAIVRRDASGNFSATTITANLTGSASNNVLKAGDTMTGTLNMATQNAIDFYDAANTAFVGINAPAVVPTSYTVSLPSTVPTAHQVMRANSVTPTNLEWFTEGGSVLPANSEMIYVAKYGNDSTGDGSFSNPYLTLSKAVNVANGLATLSNPIVIVVAAGVYVEDNSATPISVNAQGVSIVGASSTGVTIIPSTPANTLLLVNQTALIRDMTFANELGVSSAVGISFSSGAFSSMSNLYIINFQSGVMLAGGVGQSYILDNCLFVGNGTGLVINDTDAECNSCTFVGSTSVSGPPANTGINATGVNSNVIVTGGTFVECNTGFNINNNATLTASSVTFKVCIFDIVVSSAAQMTLSDCNFAFTNGPGDIEIQVSDAGTFAQIVGCEFNGNSTLGSPEATGIMVSNNAAVEISGGSMTNYTTGLVVGLSTDTSSTRLSASSFTINNCTTDIEQQGTSTLTFNAGVAASSAITVNNATNVSFAYFDTDANNALAIGSTANVNTTLIQVNNDPVNTPRIAYLSSLYSTQGIGFQNLFGIPSTVFVEANANATLAAITTLRTDTAGVRLVSDTGTPVGGTSALRGWDIIKNGSAAQLAFNYQNSDTVGQSVIPQRTIMQLDGVNNQLQLPTAGTQIVFDADTNLYRSGVGVLQTNNNFIVGTLTSGKAVVTDSLTDQLASSITTGTEISYLSGVTSLIQPQLNNKVSRSGDTMTGTLQLPAGSTGSPSLTFTGNSEVGLSANTSNLSFSTLGLERMAISSGGVVSIDAFTVPGVVHNDASGNLSSSLIINTDISPTAAITDSKLATISTAGKVANSATTATSVNNPSTIVLRDASGNFSAGTITANLNGNATTATSAGSFSGSFSGDVTGTQSATVVSFVGGVTAANVASGANAANAATSVNTPSTIVKRDASGNFSAGTITASLNGNATTATTATTATNFTGSLAGDVTGTQSATVVSLVGGVTAANVASGANAANAATSVNTPSTIVKRDASGNFSAGTITASLNGNATTATSSGSFSGSLAGDVTGTQSATVVSFVGGQSAASVASAVTTVNAATSANTPSTLVKRDGSGNFSAGIISANSISLPITTSLTVGTIQQSGVSLLHTFGSLNTFIGDGAGNFTMTGLGSNTGVGAGTLKANTTGDHNTAVGTDALVFNTSGSSNTGVGAFALSANTAGSQNSAFGYFALSANTTGPSNTAVGWEALSANQVGGGNTAVGSNALISSTASSNTAVGAGALNDITTGAQNTAVGGSAGALLTGSNNVVIGFGTVSSVANTGSNNIYIDGSGSLNPTNESNAIRIGNTQTAAFMKGIFGVSLVSPQVVTAVSGGQLGSTTIVSLGTSSNTGSTLVARDGSGNFSAGTITANLIGNVTGNATTATTATNFTGSLAGDVTGTQSATVVSLVGGVTAANVASGANAANAATNLNTPNTIVKRDGSGNFSAGTITASLNGNATTATSSGSFSGSLAGDVTGTQSATVVSLVGGVTAANVASGANAANAATNLNTASTIVKRDASGNFSAGTITANLTGNVTGNATTATTATNFTGSLAGDVTGTQSATVVSLVGGVTAANVASGASAANAATNLNTPNTIVKRDGSGNFSAGTITASLNGNATTATSSGSFSGSLAGDVTGTQSATVVSLVGGVTAANVASGANAANAATNLNTASTIVKRDASGNFSAGTITASLNGNATTATTATNFTGSLAGDVTGTQSATVVSLVGGVTAANVASGANAANAATNLNTASTIVKRDASGNFAAGIVSVVDVVASTLITTAAGSAASPSINFTGSTNTGFSAPTANTLSFDTNGVERMSISGTAITAEVPFIQTNINANQAIQEFTVTANNQSVTASTTTSILLLQTTANRTGLAITFPASPTNGQYFTILLGSTFSISVTNTGPGGATIVNGVTSYSSALGAAAATYLYYAPTTSWYRIGTS